MPNVDLAEETMQETFERLQATQNAFWEAMADMESCIPGLELESGRDYSDMELDDLIAEGDECDGDDDETEGESPND